MPAAAAAPGEHRAARRPRRPRLDPPRGRPAVDVELLELARRARSRHRRTPRRRRAGWSPGRRPGSAHRGGRERGDRLEVGFAFGAHQHGERAAAAVGRERRADGTSRSTRPGSRGRERAGDDRRASSRASAHDAEPLVGQRGQVAGAERQHDVARPRDPPRDVGEVGGRAAGTRPAASGCGRAPRAATSRPDTPGIGVSPAGYTSVSTSASAPVNASAKSRQIDAVRVYRCGWNTTIDPAPRPLHARSRSRPRPRSGGARSRR